MCLQVLQIIMVKSDNAQILYSVTPLCTLFFARLTSVKNFLALTFYLSSVFLTQKKPQMKGNI